MSFRVYFVLVFFSPFSIAITSLGEERANINAFRTFFVRLFDFCLFGFVGFLFFWGLGRAAVCNCGTPGTFLLPFLVGCDSPLSQQQILGFSCPLHLFENTWHFPPYNIPNPPVQGHKLE